MQAILLKFTRSTTQGVSHLWVAATISTIALLSGGRAAADSTPNPFEIRVGDSVRVALLAGVNAPPYDAGPYPAVLKVVGEVLRKDGTSWPLGEARLIAAAKADLTHSRTTFYLTRLRVRQQNGTRKEFAVNGWIVGEDGVKGIKGTIPTKLFPVNRAGIEVSREEAIRLRNEEIDCRRSQAPLLSAGWYSGPTICPVQVVFPAVQVPSGTQGTAVFSEGVVLKR